MALISYLKSFFLFFKDTNSNIKHKPILLGIGLILLKALLVPVTYIVGYVLFLLGVIIFIISFKSVFTSNAIIKIKLKWIGIYLFIFIGIFLNLRQLNKGSYLVYILLNYNDLQKVNSILNNYDNISIGKNGIRYYKEIYDEKTRKYLPIKSTDFTTLEKSIILESYKNLNIQSISKHKGVINYCLTGTFDSKYFLHYSEKEIDNPNSNHIYSNWNYTYYN